MKTSKLFYPFIALISLFFTTPLSAEPCNYEIANSADSMYLHMNYDGMIKLLDRVSGRDNDVCWYYYMGLALIGEDKYDATLKVLTEGHQKFPKDLDLIVNLSETYDNLLRFDDSLALLKTAIAQKTDIAKKLKNNTKVIRKSLLPTNWLLDAMAQHYEFMGNYSFAKKIYDFLIKNNPGDTIILINSSFAEAALGNYDAVVKRTSKAIKQGIGFGGKAVIGQALVSAAYYTDKQHIARKYLDELFKYRNRANSIVIGKYSFLFS